MEKEQNCWGWVEVFVLEKWREVSHRSKKRCLCATKQASSLKCPYYTFQGFPVPFNLFCSFLADSKAQTKRSYCFSQRTLLLLLKRLVRSRAFRYVSDLCHCVTYLNKSHLAASVVHLLGLNQIHVLLLCSHYFVPRVASDNSKNLLVSTKTHHIFCKCRNKSVTAVMTPVTLCGILCGCQHLHSSRTAPLYLLV